MLTTFLMFLAISDGAPAASPSSPASPVASDQASPPVASDQPTPMVASDQPSIPVAADPTPLEPTTPQAVPVENAEDDRGEMRLHLLDLEAKVKMLSAETAAARAEAKAAHARADLAYDAAQNAKGYHSGAGLGALLPLGAGKSGFGVDAHLRWLTAQWVPASGIGIGIAPSIEVSRVRLKLFDLGVFYDYGTALTVPDIKRKLDITLAAGIDVRIWNSLALHTQIGWFLPNPVSLYDAAVAKFDAGQNSNGSTGTNGSSTGVDQAGTTAGNAKDAGQYAINRLGDAFKSPMLTIAVDYQF
jgi:hypothetical protein